MGMAPGDKLLVDVPAAPAHPMNQRVVAPRVDRAEAGDHAGALGAEPREVAPFADGIERRAQCDTIVAAQVGEHPRRDDHQVRVVGRGRGGCGDRADRIAPDHRRSRFEG